MKEFKAYKKIENWLHTSGQPTADQLAMLGGFKINHVINLALPTSNSAIQNEASIVCNQGINYLNIPVDFKNPTEKQFNIFCAYLNQAKGQPTLVHCELNMRVSAFVFLYRVLHSGVPQSEAEIFLHDIWTPENEWKTFVNRLLSKAKSVSI